MNTGSSHTLLSNAHHASCGHNGNNWIIAS